jgi:hypothetical protein
LRWVVIWGPRFRLSNQRVAGVVFDGGSRARKPVSSAWAFDLVACGGASWMSSWCRRVRQELHHHVAPLALFAPPQKPPTPPPTHPPPLPPSLSYLPSHCATKEPNKQPSHPLPLCTHPLPYQRAHQAATQAAAPQAAAPQAAPTPFLRPQVQRGHTRRYQLLRRH